MSCFKHVYTRDLMRYNNCPPLYARLFLFFFRKCQTTNSLFRTFYCMLFRLISSFRGLEINPKTKIGEGLYLGHIYNITINSNAIIGRDCNLHKGIVIGQENRGKRRGTPIIGNNVWIGINAAIVGRIIIGDDVLIAPNCYVNCDVPSHSVVYGNPCIIKHRNNATEEYIDNI